jgi:hypothetical protein
MFKAIEDQAWRNEATALGLSHVNDKFTWNAVTEQLSTVLFD